MASLVLGAVGAAVGFVMGGPAGAKMGWMLGSAVGGVLSAPKGRNQEGPRLGDNRLQVSTYGKVIPLIYGTVRTAGNIIWATPLQETAHKKKYGGKGGTTVTSYTYSASFALSLCNSEIAGIVRIWADGKLIYNRASTVIQSIVASSKINLTLYLGTETQTPDPTMQAYLGTANVPAYRGQAYIVFKDFQLADYGSRIPNIEVEVACQTGNLPTRQLMYNNANGLEFTWLSNNGTLGSPAIVGLSGNLLEVSVIDDSVLNPINDLVRYYIDINTGLLKASALKGRLYVHPSSAPVGILRSFSIGKDIKGNLLWLQGALGESTSAFGITYGPYAIGQYPIFTIQIGYMKYDILEGVIPSGTYLQGVVLCVDRVHVMVVTTNVPAGTGGLVYSWYILKIVGRTTQIVKQGTVETYTNPPSTIVNTVNFLTFGLANFNVSYSISGMLEEDLCNFWVFNSTSNELSQWYIDSNNIMTKKFYVQNIPSGSAHTFNNASIWTTNGLCFIVENNLFTIYSRLPYNSGQSVTVSSILSNLTSRVTSTPIDISTITDSCPGFAIASQMSVRSAIGVLQSAYFFDVVDIDSTIKFISKKLANSTQTILESDLKTDEPTLNIIRTDESELPSIVHISYYDLNNAYLQGIQTCARQVVNTKDILNIELPICLTGSTAKYIADTSMYNKWISRSTTKFSTTHKYSYLTPSDVITITKSSGISYTLKLNKCIENIDGTLDWEAYTEDLSSFTQSVVATTPLVVQNETIEAIVPTNYELLDIPIIVESDNDGGFYTVGTGYDSTNWHGGILMRSVDGITFDEVAIYPVPATNMGSTTVLLGNFLGGNIVDEINSINVVLFNGGTLSSISYTNLLNGYGNLALVGNEIVRYRDATLVSTGVYRLNGLIRGMFGTGNYISTHSVGERFIVLDRQILQRLILSDFGLVRYYKGVSTGEMESSIYPTTFTNTSAGLKPLPPVQIGGGRAPNGDITINWVRCTRIGASWSDNVDASLGETTESYSIDIMSGTTVKRTLTSTIPTVVYTGVQQGTDFGSQQASLLVNIYQISSTVGRGFAGIKTI